MNLKLLVFFLLTGFILGCSPNKKKHPNFDQLPSPGDVDHMLSLKQHTDSNAGQSYSSDSLKQRVTITEDSTGNPLYEVQEVQLDPTGNVYLSSPNSQSIAVYDGKGNFRYNVGRKGKGPGEFHQITTFDFSSSYEKLYVLDRNEIEIFELKGDKYEYSNSFQHRLMFPQDLCILNKSLYISGFKHKRVDSMAQSDTPYKAIQLTDGPIQRYDLQANKYINDFGPYYESYSGMFMLDALLSGMMLSCNETTNTIVGLQDTFAYFYGYTPAGKRKWISRLQDYKYPEVVETKLNTPNPQYKASPGYSFRPFRETGSKYVIAQLQNTLPDLNPPSVRVNTETGKLSYAGNALETIFAYSINSAIATIQVDTAEKISSIQISETR